MFERVAILIVTSEKTTADDLHSEIHISPFVVHYYSIWSRI